MNESTSNYSNTEYSLQGNIQSRIKQITFGKNTFGYQRYLMLVPKEKRKEGDPTTPDVYEKTSKRRFEGKVKKWRRQLHFYDPKTKEEMDELTNHLHNLSTTVPIRVETMDNEEDDIDMSLWDLL